jgi:hypothetical protein
MKKTLLLTLCAVVSSVAAQATTLYTIGPDPSTFTPDRFTKINTGTQATTQMFSLANGTLGFNGGVAYDAGSNLFYTMSNDSQGNSQLESLSLAGPTFTGLLSPGTGFNGGLTFDGANHRLYAVENDVNGASTLFAMPPTLAGSASPVLSLGVGFTGGLAYDSLNGLLYAISNDGNGTSTLEQINTAGNGSVTPLAVILGSGFLGGLAFDPTSNLFYAIGSDNTGFSTLYSFNLASNHASALFGLGFGYINAGLAIAPDMNVGPPVPEPSALSFAVIGLAAVGIGSLRHRNRSSHTLRLLSEQQDRR